VGLAWALAVSARSVPLQELSPEDKTRVQYVADKHSSRSLAELGSFSIDGEGPKNSRSEWCRCRGFPFAASSPKG